MSTRYKIRAASPEAYALILSELTNRMKRHPAVAHAGRLLIAVEGLTLEDRHRIEALHGAVTLDRQYEAERRK